MSLFFYVKCSFNEYPFGECTFSQEARICDVHDDLTITVQDGRGVTLALTLLHGGGSEGLSTLVRRLPGVGQTLDCPHLLSQTTLGRTLQQNNTQIKLVACAGVFIHSWFKKIRLGPTFSLWPLALGCWSALIHTHTHTAPSPLSNPHTYNTHLDPINQSPGRRGETKSPSLSPFQPAGCQSLCPTEKQGQASLELKKKKEEEFHSGCFHTRSWAKTFSSDENLGTCP